MDVDLHSERIDLEKGALLWNLGGYRIYRYSISSVHNTHAEICLTSSSLKAMCYTGGCADHRVKVACSSTVRSLTLASTWVPHFLQVPMSVSVRSTKQGPGAADRSFRIVNWIDSKGTFGDLKTHTKQLDDQYRTYINR